MKRLFNFVIVLIDKTIFAMEKAEEELKVLARKAQKPSASGNLRSLTNSVKHLKELELLDDKDSKSLEEIVKRITSKWIDNSQRMRDEKLKELLDN